MPNSASGQSRNSPRLAILGGGIIGLSAARELAARGAHVTVFEKQQPGRGASWAAAGMLAPAYEAATEPGGHPRLFELCMRSAAMWGAFAAELKKASGREIGYRPGPSFAVATTEGELTRLDEICRELKAHGLPVLKMSAKRLRAIDPSIGPSVKLGLQLASDGHVDNRSVIGALVHMCERSPHVEIRTDVEITDLGALHADYDAVICTAGWQTRKLLPAADSIQPIAGQMLSVAAMSGGPSHTIRCGATYIVPKGGRVIIGATMEYDFIRRDTDAASIETLKRAAAELCPILGEAETMDTWAGVRPGTPDHAPMIGPSGEANVFVAAGHYRNGILLAPITAKIIADMVLDGVTSDLAAAFSPNRFVEAAL